MKVRGKMWRSILFRAKELSMVCAVHCTRYRSLHRLFCSGFQSYTPTPVQTLFLSLRCKVPNASMPTSSNTYLREITSTTRIFFSSNANARIFGLILIHSQRHNINRMSMRLRSSFTLTRCFLPDKTSKEKHN